MPSLYARTVPYTFEVSYHNGDILKDRLVLIFVLAGTIALLLQLCCSVMKNDNIIPLG